MKNSKECAKKISELYRSLKQKYPKAKKVTFEDPLDAVVYGVVCEHLRSSLAKNTVKKMKKYFVDWNDLRVSRKEEVLEVLESDNAVSKKIAAGLTATLGSIFNRYDTLSLSSLVEIGKRPAKKELEELDGVSRFVANYCFLTAFDGHAIPLTQKMIDYLRDNDLVHAKATDDEIEGFLERQIATTDGYNFYSLLRSESKTAKKKTKKAAKETATKKVSKTKNASSKKVEKSSVKKNAAKKVSKVKNASDKTVKKTTKKTVKTKKKKKS